MAAGINQHAWTNSEHRASHFKQFHILTTILSQ